MSIETKEVLNDIYGNCVSITNGKIEMVITIDYGPEIIFFGRVGKENLLYNSKNEFKDNKYNGHRMWLSREVIKDDYKPQDLAVVYSILNDGASFSTAPLINAELKFKLEIIMNNDTEDVMIVHTVKNLSKGPKTVSISSLTSVCGGDGIIVPQAIGGVDYLPNRMVSFWPYSKIKDDRFFIGDRYITLTEDKSVFEPFKFGINDSKGWVSYINNDSAFVKRFVYNSDALYPEFGSSLEVYTSGDYMGIETISPLYDISYNEVAKHVENWSIFDIDVAPELKNEVQIDKFIDSL